MARGVWHEAGSNWVPDEVRYGVADVILARVYDPRFPDSVKEVLLQKGQYACVRGGQLLWPARANNPGEQIAVARAYTIAYDVLTHRRHSRLWGKGYIWQANFKQGKDVVKVGNMYFGR